VAPNRFGRPHGAASASTSSFRWGPDAGDRPAGPDVGAVREDHLGPQRRHEPDALGAHRVRHDQDEVPVARGTGEGQTDAGVAAGRFDDGRVRVQASRQRRPVEHGRADAVLDGVGGVERHQFREEVVGESAEAEQRRLADQVGGVVCDLHRRG